MKTEDIISLDLNSLCVYKGIFQEKIGDKFKGLVDKIVAKSEFSECLKAYNDFVYELFLENRKYCFSYK